MSFKTKALAALLGGSIAVSGYVFSQRSLDNIKEVNPKLQALADCALKYSTVDFVVVDGMRTDAEHKANLAKGVSWIKRSKHQDGLAIDVAAYVNGSINFEPKYYYPIAGAFYLCSLELNTPIISGGEWHAKDYMHIELRDE